MSQGTMKPIGAAALVLSCISLLTVSSSTSGVTSASSQPTNQVSSSTTTSAPSASSQSTTQGILSSSTATTSVTPTSNASAKTESNLAPTSLQTPPTLKPSELADNQTNNGTDISIKLNQTIDQYHPTTASTKIFSSNNHTSENGTNVTTVSPAIKPTGKYITTPDIGTTKVKTKDNTTAGQHNNVNGIDQIASVNNAIGQEENMDIENHMNGEKQSSTKNKNGIVIGVGCVLAVIVLVVLVFLYKICQKKAPASENTGLKVSAPNKESVKLLSVKTATPYTDAKRISSNQMEFIEC
ncbi:endomucin [Mixophyes fleayi]|uniref:endomucin n=1 Tax=Mixophyes fleayi TaxID=3061075 RepID=UPI003F4E0DC9